MQVLSPAEMQAVFAFLSLNVEEFSQLAPYEMPLKVRIPTNIVRILLASMSRIADHFDNEAHRCSLSCP